MVHMLFTRDNKAECGKSCAMQDVEQLKCWLTGSWRPETGLLSEDGLFFFNYLTEHLPFYEVF